MRILVTGKNGQLGQSLQKILNTSTKINNNQSSDEFIFVGRQELDLSIESDVSHYFDINNKFDIIINCSAFTAVDEAEQEIEIANQVNHLAVKRLASIANKIQAKLIHISTDYVFDGGSNKPYIEADIPNPVNVYGRTKLAGEKALQAVMPTNAIIIRTSWLYSEYGNNFVKIIQRLSKERDVLKVVSDQIGSPTYAGDLANAILEIINNKKFRELGLITQIYHYANIGEISWYEFAFKILKDCKNCKIFSEETKQMKGKIRRPRYTPLNSNKIAKAFDIKIFRWEESLFKMQNNGRME
jgi:dTDP-4-dehydrorhamnose reductase